MHSTTIQVNVMFDNGESQSRAFLLGRVVRLENPLQFVRWNARTGVGNHNLYREIRTAARRDGDVPAADQRLPRILQQVRQDLGEMPALHKQRRQGLLVVPPTRMG